jgi:hydroxymethylpyrimidine/phosphomethylpyrimidine kinase
MFPAGPDGALCASHARRATTVVGGMNAGLRTTPRAAREPESANARAPVALTIAGSDSGGGAGIQADLKAFARCGVHGTCAITAVTAQDTTDVRAIHAVPGDIVLAQARTVIADLGVDAVKVGMLGSASVASAVVRLLEDLPSDVPVVVDPLLRASSGARLLDARAQSILRAEIVPRATVLTPNVPEARALAESDADDQDDDESHADGARELLLALARLGPHAVVLTGGHRRQPVDLFWEEGVAETPIEIAGERHRTGADHGSGCTHSAVLAAELARGATPLAAARRARELTGLAIAHGLVGVGGGSGPVDVLGTAHRPRRAGGGKL